MEQGYDEMQTSAGPSETNGLNALKDAGKSIIFVPTNGAGLGHLTRLLAVARRLKKQMPHLEIVFFSTSLAKHLIEREGFVGYHLLPLTHYNPPITASQWNSLLLEQLGRVLNIHQPQMLIFDGTYPYLGLIRSMKQMTDIKKVWLKREGSKASPSDKACKEKEKFFDYIITPREAGLFLEEPDRIYCDPIIYLEKSEILDREQLLKQWKVPKNAHVVYIQLGAGNINDITSDISILVQSLKQRKDIFIVLGQSIIGKELNIKEKNIMILKDYPNSRFYGAFDLAISACGYNSFHELLHFGVPTIFIPNMATQKDDQFGRALRAVRAKAALILKEVTPASVTTFVERALMHRNTLSKNALSLVPKNGADSVVQFITSHYS